MPRDVDQVGSDPTRSRSTRYIHPRWLVTVRKDEGFALEPVLERWDRSTDLAAHGVGFLVYGLLDVVVDRSSPPSTSSTTSTTT